MAPTCGSVPRLEKIRRLPFFERAIRLCRPSVLQDSPFPDSRARSIHRRECRASASTNMRSESSKIRSITALTVGAPYFAINSRMRVRATVFPAITARKSSATDWGARRSALEILFYIATDFAALHDLDWRDRGRLVEHRFGDRIPAAGRRAAEVYKMKRVRDPAKQLALMENRTTQHHVILMTCSHPGIVGQEHVAIVNARDFGCDFPGSTLPACPASRHGIGDMARNKRNRLG